MQLPPGVLVFDIETQRTADEVGGWSHVADMAMSVGVIWDSSDERFHVYREGEEPQLQAHLERGQRIVGFNQVQFDMQVLAGALACLQGVPADWEKDYHKLCKLPNYDILREVSRVLGHRLRLDSLARATLQNPKSADGLQAIAWYREGKIDEIIKYCQQDVAVTRDLYCHVLEHGKLFYEARGGTVKEVVLPPPPPMPVSAAQDDPTSAQTAPASSTLASSTPASSAPTSLFPDAEDEEDQMSLFD